MNNTTLENSIREEAARAIAVIKEKEADEIRKLNEDYALKINDFRKKSETETQTRIDQELSGWKQSDSGKKKTDTDERGTIHQPDG